MYFLYMDTMNTMCTVLQAKQYYGLATQEMSSH